MALPRRPRQRSAAGRSPVAGEPEEGPKTPPLPLHVLLLEDSAADAELILHELRRGRLRAGCAAGREPRRDAGGAATAARGRSCSSTTPWRAAEPRSRRSPSLAELEPRSPGDPDLRRDRRGGGRRRAPRGSPRLRQQGQPHPPRAGGRAGARPGRGPAAAAGRRGGAQAERAAAAAGARRRRDGVVGVGSRLGPAPLVGEARGDVRARARRVRRDLRRVHRARPSRRPRAGRGERRGGDRARLAGGRLPRAVAGRDRSAGTSASRSAFATADGRCAA